AIDLQAHPSMRKCWCSPAPMQIVPGKSPLNLQNAVTSLRRRSTGLYSNETVSLTTLPVSFGMKFSTVFELHKFVLRHEDHIKNSVTRRAQPASDFIVLFLMRSA
ncbi:MAG: hypothetical protein WBE37_26015, partial [Bryobacteraceae bacterium]